MTREAFVKSATTNGLEATVEMGPHRLVADGDKANGGSDEGPDPHEFLCIGLGACTTMTLQLYARRKQWPLERVEVKVRWKKGEPEVFERDLKLVGALDQEQRSRLLEIANKCPVHKTLTASSQVVTKLEA